FLTKPFREQELLDGIRNAIERDRTMRAERQERTELQRRYASLTPRERDVLARIVGGLLNKQIAGELGTSEATVKEQRGHVMTKMQAGSVAELVRFASRLGITPAGGGQGQVVPEDSWVAPSCASTPGHPHCAFLRKCRARLASAPSGRRLNDVHARVNRGSRSEEA